MVETLEDITVARTRLPDDLELFEELGKGSNNRVLRARYKGEDCAFRAPRRRSDTQQRGSALWEYKHLQLASDLKVGPRVLTAWFARHATREWPSGLYVVMERFEYDLETALCGDRDVIPRALARRNAVENDLVRCLARLADAHLFVYDLKPSNVVVQLGDADEVRVRVIDFGRDFCEWSSASEADPTRSSPNIDMLRRRMCGDPDHDVDKRIYHVLFATMMIVLSATTTRCLYEDRGHHRLCAEERTEAHPLRASVNALLDSMRDRDLQLVRYLLRTDDVRGVLRHYHGRRNSGTGRSFAYARGHEHGTN